MSLKNIQTTKHLSELTSEQIKELQQILKNCGYDLGNFGTNRDGVDGILGAKTTSAFNSFKRQNFLEHPNLIGKTTVEKLLRFSSQEKYQPAVELIKEYEGFRRNAYLCPAGVWTVGIGTTVYPDGRKVKRGDTITFAKAEELLLWYIKDRIVPKLSGTIPYWSQMKNHQQCALISFAYNVGEHFYGAKGYKTITRVLREKRWTDVPATMKLYVNPGSSFEEGLKRRRKKEGRLWDGLW